MPFENALHVNFHTTSVIILGSECLLVSDNWSIPACRMGSVCSWVDLLVFQCAVLLPALASLAYFFVTYCGVQVVVCGGGTFMPMVQRSISSLLPDSQLLNVHPVDEVIAIGAAKQACLFRYLVLVCKRIGFVQ